MPKEPIAIFWHRRDLRIEDNAGLYHALKGDYPVLPLFIFDYDILSKLESDDMRMPFIRQYVEQLDTDYHKHKSALLVKYGKPMGVWKDLLKEYDIKAVYTNRDYEPYSQERDKAIYEMLRNEDIPFKGYKDHVIFEKDEVVKDDGDPYVVYTPYSKKWKAKLNDFYLKAYQVKDYTPNLYKAKAFDIPSLRQMGFKEVEVGYPPIEEHESIIKTYDKTRNFPAKEDGTTHMGVHYRFGTVSIREYALRARKLNETYLDELIWRDFFIQILYHFPRTVDEPFYKKYEAVPWINNKKHFKRWCEGKTGYPIVDGGMRELNATGYMHNRVRMVVASFLTKHLLTDWRWGERYFAEKLLDYELASNVGNWQWAAGCGVDAAPYFRVFNPMTQVQKFDKEKKYIKKWVPELGTDDYPKPIVEHKEARERAIETYKKAIN